ncbi:DUF4232 domain-containing protein [Streptomyces sp. NPDC093089]|uniref:DUF4232 domain-containing protein n=1 Tax=Streptomyces sp. NPDC093089 TaxID=3366024 RepID=UPI0037FB53F4
MRTSVSRRTGRAHTEARAVRGWKPYAVGAVVVAALLTSTACQGAGNGSGQGKGPGSGTGTARPSATGPSAPGGTPSAKPTDGGASPSAGTPTETSPAKPGATTGGSGKGKGKGGSGNDGGASTIPTCTQEQLAVSSELEPPDSKEHRHLLLTVQNVSDKQCNLYRYPHVRLGADSQADTPVIKDTDPDPGKPVTLAPGREGYAALLVSGGHRDEYEARSLSLTLQGPQPGTRVGSPVDVPLPVAKLHADDGQLVTYWTTASGFALRAITSR